MEFTDAEKKQVRDTLNKQRRLCEMYHMRAIAGSVPANVLGHLADSTRAVAQVVLREADKHDAATVKAAAKLEVSVLVMQHLYQQAVEAAEVAAKADKPAPKAKAAKTATKKKA